MVVSSLFVSLGSYGGFLKASWVWKGSMGIIGCVGVVVMLYEKKISLFSFGCINHQARVWNPG